jgi:hypothetical protein
MISTTNLTLENLTTPSSRHLPSSLMFFFNHIYLLLLVIVGCIGNTFVIIIFGQRAVRTTVRCIGSSMSAYPFLFYMAISDTLYLMVIFCLWLSNYINVLHRPVICQVTLYLTYVCNFINAYYTIAFTAQRLFAVINPFRVSHVLSWYRSRCIALSIIMFACLLYSYIPFLTAIVDDKCLSRKKYRWINRYMDVIDSVIVFLVPYIVLITMNTIILISLRRMKQNPDEPLFQNHCQLNKIREITRRNASRKMTNLLLTVSTAYLIICAPYASIHTWRLLSKSGEEIENLTKIPSLLSQLETYSLLIYHLSFAMNFYIYIVFGSKFRRELKRFLTKSRQQFYHYFREQKFDAIDDNQLELTEKNSSITTADYTYNTDVNNDNNHNNNFIRKCFCCHFHF